MQAISNSGLNTNPNKHSDFTDEQRHASREARKLINDVSSRLADVKKRRVDITDKVEQLLGHAKTIDSHQLLNAKLNEHIEAMPVHRTFLENRREILVRDALWLSAELARKNITDVKAINRFIDYEWSQPISVVYGDALLKMLT